MDFVCLKGPLSGPFDKAVNGQSMKSRRDEEAESREDVGRIPSAMGRVSGGMGAERARWPGQGGVGGTQDDGARRALCSQ
jgi:hypothetical protein